MKTSRIWGGVKYEGLQLRDLMNPKPEQGIKEV
jgi:hypothetical protein